jgi:hypothetical protein
MGRLLRPAAQRPLAFVASLHSQLKATNHKQCSRGCSAALARQQWCCGSEILRMSLYCFSTAHGPHLFAAARSFKFWTHNGRFGGARHHHQHPSIAIIYSGVPTLLNKAMLQEFSQFMAGRRGGQKRWPSMLHAHQERAWHVVKGTPPWLSTWVTINLLMAHRDKNRVTTQSHRCHPCALATAVCARASRGWGWACDLHGHDTQQCSHRQQHSALNAAHDGDNTQRLRRVIRMHSLPSCAPVLGLVVLPNANHASILARS